MKVFLTGATGFVGKHMARRLLEDGHELTCLARDTDSPESAQLEELGAGLAVGNILDADSVVAGAAGAAAVIHLVGIIFERRGATFEEIHVHGTVNALAAAAMAGAGRYIHMSALGTGPRAASAYHKTKWAAEEQVRGSGLDYTIFRPSTIIGPGGEFFNMLARQVRLSPVLPVIGNGRYRMQPVSVFDVAACFSKSIENPRARNQVYEIGGPDRLTYNEMLDVICQVMGKRRAKLHIPVPAVKLVAWLGERLMPSPLLTTDQLKMLLVDNVCDTGKMRADLGVDPAPLAEAVRSALSGRRSKQQGRD
jgi:uncharacterized protein YbjT (DUF2867 family)